jgi:hypothetical protein
MEVQAAAFLNLSISLPKAPSHLFWRGAAFLADPAPASSFQFFINFLSLFRIGFVLSSYVVPKPRLQSAIHDLLFCHPFLSVVPPPKKISNF